MDFVPSVFQFDQLDELFQFSSIQQEKLIGPPPLLINKPDYSRRRKSGVSVDDSPIDYKKKKIIHRDVERQRRQEMAGLYQSLRSLLPIEYLKGKRSISDHMYETVKYIRHLQKKVEELNEKKEELKSLNPSTLNIDTYDQCSPSCQRSSVTVKTCRAGMEVVVSTPMRGGLPLSRVLNVLIGEGLAILSCISTTANARLLHTIESEVNDGSSVNPTELQQKLTDLVI